MKIPLVLAESHLPALQSPRLPAGVSAIPSLPVPAQRGDGLGAGISDIGRSLAIVADAQEAKRQQFAKDEAASAAADFQLRVKSFDAQLKMTERDPDAYTQRFGEELTNAEQEIARGMKSDQGRALFNAKAKAARVTLEPEALVHANTLYRDRADGLGLTLIERKYQLAGSTPLSQHAEWLQHYRDAAESIEARRWLHGDKATSEALAANRQRFFTQRAYQHAHANPEEFLAQADVLYGGNPKTGEPGLDPKQRDVMYEQAITARDRTRRERQTEADRLVKDSQNEIASQLRERIEAGEDLFTDITGLSRELGEQQHKELLALNRTLREQRETKARTGDTDAAKLASDRRRVMLAAGIYDGSVTRQSQILTAGDLRPDDTVTVLGLLRAERERRENKAETERDQVIRDQLGVIRQRLKLVGPLQFDALESEVQSRAVNEYVTRVRADRTLDPVAHATAIIQQYQPALAARQELSARDVARVLSVNPDLARQMGEGRLQRFQQAIPLEYRKGNAREGIARDVERGKLSQQDGDDYFRILDLLEFLQTKPEGGATTPTKPKTPAATTPKKEPR